MTYLQIQNTDNLPYATVNEYDVRYDYIKCGNIIDIRNFGNTHIEPHDIFKVRCRSNSLDKMPAYGMDVYYFNEYDATLMKQNNKEIIAKMAKDIIKIEATDYCLDLKFNETQKIKLFHFPDKCLRNNKYYATCQSIGGVSRQHRNTVIVMIVFSAIFVGIPVAVMTILPFLIMLYCCTVNLYDKYRTYRPLDDEEI